MEKIVKKVVKEIIRQTKLKDWKYVYYHGPEPWAAIYRKAWNANSAGPRNRRGTINGHPARGRRPVIWFEIVLSNHNIGTEENDNNRLRDLSTLKDIHLLSGRRISRSMGRLFTLSTINYIHLPSDLRIRRNIQRYKILLDILRNYLPNNPNVFSIDFLFFIIRRLATNRMIRALEQIIPLVDHKKLLLNTAAIAQYVVDRYTLFDAHM